MKKTSKPRIPTIACPHCNARAMARTSEQLSPLYREMRLRCEDDDCGHQFVVQVSIIRTVVPSRKANPAIRLPFSNPNLTGPDRSPQPGNDNHRFPDNDTDDQSGGKDDAAGIGALLRKIMSD